MWQPHFLAPVLIDPSLRLLGKQLVGILSSVGLRKLRGYTNSVVLSLACLTTSRSILLRPVQCEWRKALEDASGDNQSFPLVPPAERKLERCLSGFRNKNNLGQKSRYGSATLTIRSQVVISKERCMCASTSGKKKPTVTRKSKRPYVGPQVRQISPVAAKAELQSKAIPGDRGAEEMLRRINRSLKSSEKRK